MRISDWSSDACSSDLVVCNVAARHHAMHPGRFADDLLDAHAWIERGEGILKDHLDSQRRFLGADLAVVPDRLAVEGETASGWRQNAGDQDRKSTRLNSSH